MGREQGVHCPRVPAGLWVHQGSSSLPPASPSQQSLADCCSAPAHGTAWTHLAGNIPFDAPHLLFNISSASLLLLSVTGAVPHLLQPTPAPSLGLALHSPCFEMPLPHRNPWQHLRCVPCREPSVPSSVHSRDFFPSPFPDDVVALHLWHKCNSSSLERYLGSRY